VNGNRLTDRQTKVPGYASSEQLVGHPFEANFWTPRRLQEDFEFVTLISFYGDTKGLIASLLGEPVEPDGVRSPYHRRKVPPKNPTASECLFVEESSLGATQNGY
jgi:hypothetical protein